MSIAFLIQKTTASRSYSSPIGGEALGLGNGHEVPEGVTVDSLGNVYVSDSGNSRIQKSPVSSYPGGEALVLAIACWGILKEWLLIALAMSVADRLNDRIQKFSSSGVFLAKWSSSGHWQQPLQGSGRSSL